MPDRFNFFEFKNLKTLAEAAPTLDALQSSRAYSDLLQAIAHPVVDIRNDVVKRVQEVGDKNALPQLIQALKDVNFPAMGSEQATAQVVYKENLIKAVNSLSGQNFSIPDVNNVKNLNETMARMTKWADENL